jgi:tRNA-binding protein
MLKMNEIDFDTFLKVDMRVGKIVRAEVYPEAINPAIKLWINFGAIIGEKKSSAQITENYNPETLVGKRIVGVVNFPPRQIGSFMSQVLVLGVNDNSGKGIVLLTPELEVPLGGRVH